MCISCGKSQDNSTVLPQVIYTPHTNTHTPVNIPILVPTNSPAPHTALPQVKLLYKALK